MTMMTVEVKGGEKVFHHGQQKQANEAQGGPGRTGRKLRPDQKNAKGSDASTVKWIISDAS